MRSSPGLERIPFRRASVDSARDAVGPASTVTDETTWSISSDVGTSYRYARQDHTHGTPDVTATGGIVGWCINSMIVSPQANPTSATYIHAHRIFAPFGITLKAYGLGMMRAGAATDGNLYLSVWTEDSTNICPSAEYTSARVICFAPSLTADWNRVPLQARGITSVSIDPGYSWVIKTVEVAFGRTELPIEYWDGGAAAKGHCMAIALGGQGGFPDGTWDYSNSVRKYRTPGVYLLDY